MSKMESQVIEAALAQVEIAQDTRNRVRRKRLFIAFGATVLTCGLGYGLYSHFYASRFVSTDNAHMAAETAQVTPRSAASCAKCAWQTLSRSGKAT